MSLPKLTTEQEQELSVLQVVREGEETQQRAIARKTGMSLGLTNRIVKRLAKKGLLTVQKVTGRRMAYALTPEGVREVARRSYSYFQRTMSNVDRYRQELEGLASDAADRGYGTVELVGKSDVDFLLEYACTRRELSLSRVTLGAEDPGKAYVVAGERLGPRETAGVERAHAWLWELVSSA